MIRHLALILALLAVPARAETPNLSAAPEGTPGSAAQLTLAQRAYAEALATGEVLPLLAAIHLARSVTLRPATGWERTTIGAAPDAAPNAAPDAARPGTPSAPDPASDAALTVARNLAGEDPDLQDLVFDLDAQMPRGRTLTAIEARADLAPGQTDDWRMPLFGEVSAEIALIGDGAGPLVLSVRDAGGATVCAHPATAAAVLCRLTPARNGFFTVAITNTGGTVNRYRLIGN